jgi:uncharacterized membrane protein
VFIGVNAKLVEPLADSSHEIAAGLRGVFFEVGGVHWMIQLP